MVDSNQIQKKLNDLLAGIDDGDEDVFLVESAKQEQQTPQTAPMVPVEPKIKTEQEASGVLEEKAQSIFLSEEKPPEPESGVEEKKEETKDTTPPEERLLLDNKDGAEGAAGDFLEGKGVLIKEKQDIPFVQKEEIAIEERPSGFTIKNNGFLGKQAELNDKIRAMESDRREDQIKMKAMNLGFGYINLRGLPIMAEFLKLVEEDEAKEARLVCFFYKRGEGLRLAIAGMSPGAQELIAKIKEEHPGERVSIFLTSEESIDAALRLYASIPKKVERIDDIKVLEGEISQSSQEIGDIKEIQEKINGASTTEAMGVIIMAAARIEASDIHIEAEENDVKVRFRIDGVLHDVAVLAKEKWNHLVARIKLNAGLKINIQDRPQDGNFNLLILDKPIDFRVSTLPTNYGESVAMRILYHDKIKKMSLDNLGLDEYNRAILEKEIIKPNGLLVITGPTGSGKTTTLYSILNKLNSSDNKIITVEDPIEYKLEGINQSEVREDKGYTFAKALRSLVRQDPDVILVGEIRDEETVDIVLNAALTGHLVLSTIHTNSAAGTIPRFMALGAKPYLLSPAINVAISQRLVRRVCQACKETEALDELKKERLQQEVAILPDKYRSIISPENFDKITFYKGKGCKECSGLGYKGQIAIFEILRINDEIKNMVLAGEISEQQIKQVAAKDGMVSLAQDGILKAVRGVTSLEEVFRVA